MRPTDSEITRLLQDWNDGDPEALDRLLPLIVDDVREIARRCFRRESPAHTLQPTALVNEVYLKLTKLRTVQWRNRAHFLGEMARMMRRLLVDHARRRQSAKRGAGAPKVPLDDTILKAPIRASELVALDDALETLAILHPRQHRVVELRFFIGLTLDDVAELLGVVRSTVISDWKNARVWLMRELSREREEA